MPYNEKLADNAVNFIRGLKHTKGQWAGVNFTLLPWEEDEVLRPLFGTVREDDETLRQYRFCLVEVPKKQGKSELAAAISLKCLFADGEMGAEVYCAASDREQASIVFDVAAQMTRYNPYLSGRSKIIDSRKRIVATRTGGIYVALSKETYTKHGLNPSAVIIDEIHAHKNRELYDVLTEGTDVARRQQLVFIITTAGVHDPNHISWKLHQHALAVKKDPSIDPTFLPIIYGASKDDDWHDEKIWKKCNPSLGHIFQIDNLRTHYRNSLRDPVAQNNFRRYRLNQWVGQISRYIPMDQWDKCKGVVKKESLIKRTCYGALDLSSSQDLTAWVLVFPPKNEKEKWQVLCHFYVPADTIKERTKKDRVPYDIWAKAGHITVTPGNVIDYAFVKRDVINASKIFDLKEVAYDPWGAVQLAISLQDDEGIEMVEHRQGYKSMSPPTKDLLRYVLAGDIAHGNNPVLRWCIDNLAVTEDAAENVKPAKDKSAERIDGAVALIMALGRAIQQHKKKKSVYAERGLVIV